MLRTNNNKNKDKRLDNNKFKLYSYSIICIIYLFELNN